MQLALEIPMMNFFLQWHSIVTEALSSRRWTPFNQQERRRRRWHDYRPWLDCFVVDVATTNAAANTVVVNVQRRWMPSHPASCYTVQQLLLQSSWNLTPVPSRRNFLQSYMKVNLRISWETNSQYHITKLMKSGKANIEVIYPEVNIVSTKKWILINIPIVFVKDINNKKIRGAWMKKNWCLRPELQLSRLTAIGWRLILALIDLLKDQSA